MSQAKNISEMSVTELKALAYDHVFNIQNSQNSLNLITAEIDKKVKAEKEVPIS